MSKQNWKYAKPALIVVGLIVLGLVIQGVVNRYKNPNQMPLLESMAMDMTVKTPEGAVPVELEIARQEAFQSNVTYTGSAVAYNDIPIFPRVEGWIQSMSVYPGDRVKKGQLLARLDTRELSSRVTEAAERKNSAQNAVQTTKANFDYWENEIQRAKSLVKEEVITQEEFENEQSQYESAQSAYRQAQANLRAEQANTNTQSIIRSYSSITAPMDGLITERNVPPGTLASSGMQILKLAQIDPIRIQASVAEKDLSQIQVGSAVVIQDAKRNQPPVQATVTSVFPLADLKTRTSIVEAVVPNKEMRFIPGDYIRMSIQTGSISEAITVPKSAVITVDQQQAVWVVKDGVAERRYVTTGNTNADRIEIVEGLKPGEQVAIRGLADLRPGASIVATTFNQDGIKELPQPLSSNRLTASNHYKASIPSEHYTITAQLKTTPPAVGDNTFTFNVSSLHGKTPDNLSLDVTAMMPAMPKMRVPKPTFKKVENGRFQGKINLMMPGLWEIKVTVKQGGQTLASSVFEVEVPE